MSSAETLSLPFEEPPTHAVAAADEAIAARVEACDWVAAHASIDAYGCARLPRLLPAADCVALRELYADEARFRSRVVMARHGFGQGEYRYFADPLPAAVAALRRALYAPLVPLANRWAETLGLPTRFPPMHADYLRRCREAGQSRPTPLLLRYGPGDYNCLHQDLYGDEVFPLQVAILLSVPGREFRGGEFVLTEQRPRLQSRAEVVPLEQGDAVAFAVRWRPARGTRGPYRLNLRHGVSRLHAGERYALGIIFHDAR